MKSSMRTLAAAVLTTGLVLSGTTTAQAASAAGPSHAKHDHAKPDKDKESREERKLRIEQRNTLKRIAQADRRIARAVVAHRVDRLVPVNGVDTQAAVLANALADRAALAELQAAVEAATTGFDFRAVRRDVRQLHEENYRVVVNALRQAAELQAAADALGGVAEVTAAVDTAVAKAVLITAGSPKADLEAIFAELALAEASLLAAQQPTAPVGDAPAGV